ncbi:MAG: phenylalanine--tRNA ligase subunit beta [Sulfurovum sp.]|nr:phenylalanine--tRNA ligase subunit beta [Sulfurovum sp.]
MIITKSWLHEFIDLSTVSNETLYATFNAIGLEVDSIKEIDIDHNVVVGKILSVEKHPDADKLNVCQIDVGSGTRQIVCGAKNVVDAQYVAVAMIGAVLPENFEIKHAKLRGVESEGMVCASAELGLPSMGKGIMILDESIGTLEAGRALNTYPQIIDTIIELELTANRGDCLSVYGVARDLSAALDIEMRVFEPNREDKVKLGIARVAQLRSEGVLDADLYYKLASIEDITSYFLLSLRLAMVGVEVKGAIESLLAYATHTTGVILRAYDSTAFVNSEDKISIYPCSKDKGIVEVRGHSICTSIVGVNQESSVKAHAGSAKVLLEASYIHPDVLVEAFSQTTFTSDALYYKTSRGSNPDLEFGLLFLGTLLHAYAEFNCYEGSLTVLAKRKNHSVMVDAGEISSIIGMEIELSKIVGILHKLGFKINKMSEATVVVVVPDFRHDIKHVQDISEEIVRIIGINNIKAKPLIFAEKPRLNSVTDRYKAKKALRHRAVGAGFYENVSYVFSDRVLLDKYGFAVTEEALDLANPIAEELNTLRSTLLINLLSAVKRNVSYSIKAIPLFEIGAIFAEKREESEVMSFVFSGQSESESIQNAGKPTAIDFATFTKKVGAVIGNFELEPCTYNYRVLHPYQSANIMIEGKKRGFIAKLHPTVQEAYGIPVTFIAEMDLEVLLPTHINAKPISKFQGVYKDLSIVIEKSLQYYDVAKVLQGLNLDLLKDSYPIDIYVDEALGNQKSLTLRFFIQSMDKTLQESDIDSVMGQIITTLQNKCNATLR